MLSLVESFIELKYFHDVATPALLCHKEPDRRSPIGGYFDCSLLVLDVIGGFHARKGPIIWALMP